MEPKKNEQKKTIPNRIALLRKQMGMSQKELADIVGVVQSTISVWENGQVAIDSNALPALSKALAVQVDYLLGLSDERQSNVRNAFTKGNGSIGTQGCVSYMFDRKGQIVIDKEECDMDADDLMMLALDAGAEDFSEEEDSFEILTSPDDLEAVRETLEAKKIPMAQAEETMIPQNYVALDDETALKNLQRTLDLLEEDDDVQAVYTNLDE